MAIKTKNIGGKMVEKIIKVSLVLIVLLIGAFTYADKPLYEIMYFLGYLGIWFFLLGILFIIGQKILERWTRLNAIPILVIVSLTEGLLLFSIITFLSFTIFSFYQLHKHKEKINFHANKIKWQILSTLIGVILIIISTTTFTDMIVNIHNELVLSQDRLELYEDKYSNVKLYENNVGQIMIQDIWDHEIDDYKIMFEDKRTFILEDSTNKYYFSHYSGGWRIVKKENCN